MKKQKFLNISRNKKMKLLDHYTLDTLLNSELVFKTFMECLEEGDSDSAIEVLAASLRHIKKNHLDKK